MSWNPLLEPADPDAAGMDSIETLIVPRAVDVNPFVRRVLPAPQRQMVGPFIFFDQFGPLEMVVTAAGGVRPHPHIGLATVTYLYRGEVHHRDSLGTSQIIAPGAVNWMVAGGASPTPNAPLPSFSDAAPRYTASRPGSLFRNARRTRRRGSSIIRKRLCRSSRTTESALG